jgi:hypothetical protein
MPIVNPKLALAGQLTILRPLKVVTPLVRLPVRVVACAAELPLFDHVEMTDPELKLIVLLSAASNHISGVEIPVG